MVCPVNTNGSQGRKHAMHIQENKIGSLVASMLISMIAAPALCMGSGTNPSNPAEADLYMHLKDAFKNPREEPGLPRVLIIGDSISIGYTIPVRQRLQGRAVVFRPPVNCQHTGYGLANLKSWLGTNRWDVIHFNWGIWDTHYLDAKGALVRDESQGTKGLHIRCSPEQYGRNLSMLVEILETTGARLIWASTTPVMSRSGKRFEDIAVRNAVAEKIMTARNITINDLYTFTLPRVQAWQTPDQVHFNNEGNAQLGTRVSECILDALQSLKR